MGSRRPLGLGADPAAALALVALAPDPRTAWTTAYAVPPLFSDGAYHGCLHRRETVLSLPVTTTATRTCGR